MQRRKGRRVKSNLASKIWRIGIGFLILLIILDAYLLVTSRIFNIKQVDVVLDNVKCTDEKNIKNEIPFLGKNFFLIDNYRVGQQVKDKFFCIKSVNLSKIFPDKIKIEVFGREAVAVLAKLTPVSAPSEILENPASQSASLSAQEKIEGEFLVDREGIVFLNSHLDNLPIIYIWGSELNTGSNIGGGLIKNTLTILEKMKTYGVETKEAKLNSQNILVINPVTQKTRIIFDIHKNIETQLASLQLILTQAKIEEQEMEFIDLRYDKPVVKYVQNIK